MPQKPRMASHAESTAADRSVRPTRFLLDLALRYFVSCLYNLNGFMEPLRTGIVRGGFLCLGHLRENTRFLDFASGSLRESDASLGMTVCLRDVRVSSVMESEN
jgi:hypothetical protein